jgi:von Willebrand factor type A domain
MPSLEYYRFGDVVFVFFAACASCRPKDILFLVDSSDKTTSDAWPAILNFVNNIIGSFGCVSSTGVRFALVDYSDNAYIAFNFNQNSGSSVSDYQTAVNAVPNRGGTSDIVTGLSVACQVFLSARIFSDWITIVVTDYLSLSNTDLYRMSQAIQDFRSCSQADLTWSIDMVIAFGINADNDVDSILLNRIGANYNFGSGVINSYLTQSYDSLLDYVSPIATTACFQTNPSTSPNPTAPPVPYCEFCSTIIIWYRLHCVGHSWVCGQSQLFKFICFSGDGREFKISCTHCYQNIDE